MSVSPFWLVWEGGPLFDFDGNFLGMNCFSVTEGTFFLPTRMVLLRLGPFPTLEEIKFPVGSNFFKAARYVFIFPFTYPCLPLTCAPILSLLSSSPSKFITSSVLNAKNLLRVLGERGTSGMVSLFRMFFSFFNILECHLSFLFVPFLEAIVALQFSMFNPFITT